MRKKKVLKKRDFGRTYNEVDGWGWDHYTKGWRRRSVTQKRLNNAMSFLYAFFARAN